MALVVLAGCGGGGSSPPPPTPTYTIGGTLSGLNASTEIVLQNNGGDSVTVSANGGFTFPTAVAQGKTYSVTVLTPPTGETCTVTSASGTVASSDIADVAVSCKLSGPAVVSLSAPSVSFTATAIGSKAGVQTITLANATAASATVQSIATSDRFSQFSQTNNCGPTLPAGATCAIVLEFAPTVGGTAAGLLTVTTSPAVASGQVVLTGAAVGTYQLKSTVQTAAGPLLSGFSALPGAQITVYDATIAGSGPVIVATGISDANGNFAASYNCPASATSGTGFSDDFLYVVATGGTPKGDNAANEAIRFLSLVSPCATPPSATVIDELTTVAAAYTLHNFLSITASGDIWINAPVSLEHGLHDASELALTFVSQNGLAQLSFLQQQEPAAKTLNSLADSLGACAGPGGAASGACTSLLQAATISGAAVPADTLTAAISVASHPGLVGGGAFGGGVYGVGTNNLSYEPTAAPSSDMWWLALTYTGGGLTSGATNQVGVAVDQNNLIWITNANNSISLYSAVGVALSPAQGFTGGGLNYPAQIAIGPNGIAWVANGNIEYQYNTKGSVTQFNIATTTGSSLGNAINITGVDIDGPTGIAVDPNGNAWVSNATNTSAGDPVTGGELVEISPAGAILGSWQAPQPANTDLGSYQGAAVAANGNIWVTDGGNNGLLEFSPTSQSWLSPAGGFTGGGIVGEVGSLAIDPAGNIWVPSGGNGGFGKSPSGSVLSEFSPNGQPIQPNGVDPAQIPALSGVICIDGAGNVWVSTESGLVGVTSTGALLTPPANAAPSLASSIAADQAGNLWGIGLAGFTQLVGAAAPTATPLYSMPKAAPSQAVIGMLKRFSRNHGV